MGLAKVLLGRHKGGDEHLRKACERNDSVDLAKKRIAKQHHQEHEHEDLQQPSDVDEAQRADASCPEPATPLDRDEEDNQSVAMPPQANTRVDSVALARMRLQKLHQEHEQAATGAPTKRDSRAKRRGSWSGDGEEEMATDSSTKQGTAHHVRFRRRSDSEYISNPAIFNRGIKAGGRVFAKLLRRLTNLNDREELSQPSATSGRARPKSASSASPSNTSPRFGRAASASASHSPRAPKPLTAAWFQLAAASISQGGPGSPPHTGAGQPPRTSRVSAPGEYLGDSSSDVPRSDPPPPTKQSRSWLTRLSMGLTSAKGGQRSGAPKPAPFRRRSADLPTVYSGTAAAGGGGTLPPAASGHRSAIVTSPTGVAPPARSATADGEVGPLFACDAGDDDEGGVATTAAPVAIAGSVAAAAAAADSIDSPAASSPKPSPPAAGPAADDLAPPPAEPSPLASQQ